LLPFLFAATMPEQLGMSLPELAQCKRGKFAAPHSLYASKKFFPQHSSWDEI
jgi:hypothetical protein